ncbi:MAG: Rieske 2Fe-2S domain-containing protein [Pseudomonadota bacterium]
MSSLEGLLGACHTYLDLPVERIRTFEPGHYTSEAFYDLEIDHIWKKEWINVGHVSEVRNPGDYFTIELIGEPMMIVRGQDMRLRALSTVCRHRYMLVSKNKETGNKRRFQCPYHHWTYDTSGQLVHAMYMEDNQDFDQSTICLPEFRLEVWNDLIWVNLDDNAPPFAPKVEALDDLFSVYAPGDTWEMTNHYDKIWPGNWKNFCENNMEGYHHMGLHKDTLEIYSPTRNTTNITYGENWTRYQVLYDMDLEMAKELVEQTDWKPGDMKQNHPALDILMIHPANAFVIYPGGAGFYALWPTAVDEVRYRAGSIRPIGGDLDRFTAEGEEYDSMRPLDEDGESMPHIARGVRSSKAAAGYLTWMEEPILRWMQWISRRVVDGAAAPH